MKEASVNSICALHSFTYSTQHMGTRRKSVSTAYPAHIFAAALAFCEWMEDVLDYKQHMFIEGNKYLLRDLSKQYGFSHLRPICMRLEEMYLPEKHRAYIYLVDAILIVYNHCFSNLDMKKVYRQVEAEYGLMFSKQHRRLSAA